MTIRTVGLITPKQMLVSEFFTVTQATLPVHDLCCLSCKQASSAFSAHLAVGVPTCSWVRLCEVKYCITYSHHTLWVKGVVTQQYILE